MQVNPEIVIETIYSSTEDNHQASSSPHDLTQANHTNKPNSSTNIEPNSNLSPFPLDDVDSGIHELSETNYNHNTSAALQIPFFNHGNSSNRLSLRDNRRRKSDRPPWSPKVTDDRDGDGDDDGCHDDDGDDDMGNSLMRIGRINGLGRDFHVLTGVIRVSHSMNCLLSQNILKTSNIQKGSCCAATILTRKLPKKSSSHANSHIQQQQQHHQHQQQQLFPHASFRQHPLPTTPQHSINRNTSFHSHTSTHPSVHSAIIPFNQATPTRQSVSPQQRVSSATSNVTIQQRICKINVLLFTMKILLGSTMTGLSLYLYNISSSIKIQYCSFWASIPLLISGILDMSMLKIVGFRRKKRINIFTLSLCATLSAICIVLCLLASIFTGIHGNWISSHSDVCPLDYPILQSCCHDKPSITTISHNSNTSLKFPISSQKNRRTISRVNCVCGEYKSKRNVNNNNYNDKSVFNTTMIYEDLNCRYVFSAIKDYLILQCSLMSVGAGVSLWLLQITINHLLLTLNRISLKIQDDTKNSNNKKTTLNSNNNHSYHLPSDDLDLIHDNNTDHNNSRHYHNSSNKSDICLNNLNENCLNQSPILPMKLKANLANNSYNDKIIKKHEYPIIVNQTPESKLFL